MPPSDAHDAAEDGAAAGSSRLNTSSVELETEGAEGGIWHTRLRVLVCMWGSTFLWSSAWLGSYVVWLGDGCLVFLPFVSDFGASASPTYRYFEIAMTLAALLWLPTWFDHFRATQDREGARLANMAGGIVATATDAETQLLEGAAPTTAAHRPPSLVERIQPYVGVVCSLGIVGVALDPEDERIVIHGFSANAAFAGGVAFTWISTWLRRQRGQPWAVSLAGNIVATGSFLMLGPAVTAACVHASSCDVSDPLAWFDASFRLMHANYGEYCRGEDLPAANGKPSPGPSMHGVNELNVAAFFEWSMLIAILINIIFNFHHDMKGWPA